MAPKAHKSRSAAQPSREPEPTASPRIILVTGANRGIGFCILQALATHTPTDHFILAARSSTTFDPAIEELRELGVVANIDGLLLDVTSDESIWKAEKAVRRKYGRLDVLVNNAGIGLIPGNDLVSNRSVFTAVLETNVTSVANVTLAFMPLLKASAAASSSRGAPSRRPNVVNISSGRASITRSTTGGNPPSNSIPYTVSKAALNALTVEMQRANPDVLFHIANPGHCRTAFNGYRGTRDPLEGARVVVELVHGQYGPGFWEAEGEEGPCSIVPW